MDNAMLLLQIDNIKLAQDDFKNKYVSDRILFPSKKYGLSFVFCKIPDLIFESELFLCRLDDEIKARKVLEKDVDNLKKTHEDTVLNCKQTQKEIDLVKEELEQLNQDHKNVSDPSESGLTTETCAKTRCSSSRRWMICVRRSKTPR